MRPLLVIVSAPSGAGKTTLCERLLCEHSNIVYSVSCTTRAPRGKEKDGRDYFFLSEEAFQEHVDEGAFLEHADVHGSRYGTLKCVVEDAFEKGKSMLMDLDVQGAAQIRETIEALPEGSMMQDRFVDIFIEPPSMEVLRDRLIGRGEDSEDAIERRIRNAELEMPCRDAYCYRIVNRDIDEAYEQFNAIVLEEMTIGWMRQVVRDDLDD